MENDVIGTKFLAGFFTDHDNGPGWWQRFVLHPLIYETQTEGEFSNAVIAALKEHNGTLVTVKDLDLNSDGSPWLVYFESEEDFIVFKLAWC